MKHVGAHVSISGGVENAPVRARKIGADAFGLFLKNQRRWRGKNISRRDASNFRDKCAECGYTPSFILPHDSYLINLGHPERSSLVRSQRSFLDELRSCEKMGLTMLNFHPGSRLDKISEKECLKRIAESINVGLEATSHVTAVLETTAGQGTSVGYRFEHLARLIELVDSQERVGVCMDTCHVFAAGYDIRTEECFDRVMQEFDAVVGLGYLRGVHLNDSLRDLGERIDRHEAIGKGKIGLEAFKFIMRDPRFDDLPLIIETPYSHDWIAEIAMLKDLAAPGGEEESCRGHSRLDRGDEKKTRPRLGWRGEEKE